MRIQSLAMYEALSRREADIEKRHHDAWRDGGATGRWRPWELLTGRRRRLERSLWSYCQDMAGDSQPRKEAQPRRSGEMSENKEAENSALVDVWKKILDRVVQVARLEREDYRERLPTSLVEQLDDRMGPITLLWRDKALSPRVAIWVIRNGKGMWVVTDDAEGGVSTRVLAERLAEAEGTVKFVTGWDEISPQELLRLMGAPTL